MKQVLEHRFLILCLCFFPLGAFAYIDPGSGYMITQILVAAGIGVLFYAKKISRAVSRLFKKTARPAPKMSRVSKPKTSTKKRRKAA